ncbi:hypothetical protein EMIHUDRAFT_219752 [Emiliania huxleyi CCMP1516]|uniref:AP2/ERF domain-containing protein n=2 Tax=Emiliania huxleyi TaxID=2903 RepID=A0A0D3I412_EMIH1|nr:hypothetical protein EMIHUDRAFT_219752 [Emiliania huxleyi CCMP1516]EOD05997.1 hypothetical protein EMIHUDRAFT_219752 [Emiliania huxleyi CCMP1516]|eukprot:XP_005758426.1 hypothetical protein EMIHUDRAFT_219752 [Emiliania huxleyi CCMP1516]
MDPVDAAQAYRMAVMAQNKSKTPPRPWMLTLSNNPEGQAQRARSVRHGSEHEVDRLAARLDGWSPLAGAKRKASGSVDETRAAMGSLRLRADALRRSDAAEASRKKWRPWEGVAVSQKCEGFG